MPISRFFAYSSRAALVSSAHRLWLLNSDNKHIYIQMVWLGRAALWLDDSLSYACQQCWSHDCNVNKTHNTMTTVLWIIPSIYQTCCQYSSKLLSLYNNTVSTCCRWIQEIDWSSSHRYKDVVSVLCRHGTMITSWAVLCCVEAAN